MIDTVLIDYDNVNDALTVIYDLRDQGLVQGTDFDFKWHRPETDEMDWLRQRSGYCEYTFYSEEWATWFRLKYDVTGKN
jgi:hypothetical protein